MVFAAIVAGGKGLRCNQPMPKQFVHIGDEPVIIHTLKKFENIVDYIYVACPKDLMDYSKKIIGKYLKTDKIRLIPGGTTRMESVLCMLAAIKSSGLCNGDDIVVTHDAIRPFVSTDIIKENIKTAEKHSACGTYVSAVDTIGISENGKTVTSVPPRDTVFHAQTPQTFRFSTLLDVFAKNRETMENYTDLCSMVADAGVKVYITEGSRDNFKITTAFDMQLADFVAKSRKSETQGD